MRVKFLFNAFYGKYIPKGGIADVTAFEAKNLVEQGRAEYVEPPAAEPAASAEAEAPKPAAKKRKTTDLL